MTGSPPPRVDPAATLEIPLIGAPEVAYRLLALFAFQRWSGPHPSRKTAGQVRYYLTGRLCTPTSPSRKGERP